MDLHRNADSMAAQAAQARTTRRRGGRDARRRTPLYIALVVVLVIGGMLVIGSAGAQTTGVPAQSLDGSGNNVANPTWGQGGLPYSRVAPARYADGRSQMFTGPNARLISNRIFNDSHQNLFSERRVTQWGFAWGQFLDHTFGLRDGRSPGDPQGETANIPFNSADPLEEFENDLGVIPFVRSNPSPGTGVTNARQQTNTVSSYLDAFAVYGGTNTRLDWLREGSVDGNPTNNSARLLLPGGELPRADARGDAATAPAMELDGRLTAQPARRMIAGDVRANENIALSSTHTLFAREHNRIVSLLPSSLTQEQKFQIARRVVIAEQQYVTYNEFLPAMGVKLPRYAGYNPNVNATLSNEFATVGYRAHSMIHGELEAEVDADRFTQAEFDALEAQGVELEFSADGEEVEIAIPLNLAFFNPDLLSLVNVETILKGLGGESQYKNDEQIDNQLRSVLFQIPVSENPECLDGAGLPECFDGVVDLGAIDVARNFDHGIPTYNGLRQAYGLPAKTSFTSITGESTDQFPAGTNVNDPASLDFLQLFDIDGNPIDLADEDAVEGTATRGVRRTTIAARLRAVFGSVNSIDPFTGMLAEAHLPGADMGELQLAIWTREFQRMRDGDRFFYGNQDSFLSSVRNTYGIDYRRTLGQVILSNTDLDPSEVNANVFLVNDADLPPARCHVTYLVTTSWPGNFQVNMTVTNTGTTPVNGWTLRWEFANGQTFTDVWEGSATLTNGNVAITNLSYNAQIPVGGTKFLGFNAQRDNFTNARPPNFTLNNARCTSA